MLESVGKKLNQARLKRGLTIDEAAYATKLRPDKIAALEADDYSRFANNIYAKGFLQIYARYLNVDVSDFARTLDNANPISVSDYQYLTNAPTPRRETTHVERDERKPPSLAPLLFFVVIIAVGLLFSWIYMKAQQISQGDKTVKTTQTTEEAAPSAVATPVPAPATPAPAPARAVIAPAAATPAPAPVVAPAPAPAPAQVAVAATPFPRPQQIAATPAPQPPLVAPTPLLVRAAAPTPRVAAPTPLTFQPTNPAAATPAPVRATPAPTVQLATATPGQLPSVARTEPPRNSDQDFVRPTPVNPTTDPSTRPPASSGLNEVQVAVVKKTWVTVRKDDPKAAPIFEDYIYPSANPLKLKGARFFIDARDPNSVQITKNGLPYAYQAPNIPVQ
jgi:cytoskeletal protein RodZ